MTRQKSLKTRVRARMAKTGEAYTTARRQLLARQPHDQAPAEMPSPTTDASPEPALAAPAAPTGGEQVRSPSDEAVRARTGRAWAEWFALLDEWGARERKHPEIARWLNAEHGVDGWWSQSITVEYERARGMRDLYEHADGYTAGATRTVNVPVEALFAAFEEEAIRDRWLGGHRLSVRTSRPHRTMRFDFDGGASRVVVGFTPKGESKSTVAVQHERLADRDAAEAMQRRWRERLVALKALLEGAG